MAKVAKKPTKKTAELIESVTPVVQSNLVVTYNGKSVPRSECRSIAGKFYKMGTVNIKDSGDVYLMGDGTYYRINNNKIAWNHSKEQYDFIDRMVKGYVPGGMGYFNAENRTHFKAVGNLYVFNEQAIKDNKLQYDFSTGEYSERPVYALPSILRQKAEYDTLPNNIYGMGEYPKDVMQMITRGVTKTFDESRNSVFDKFLFNYQYGLEIETDQGFYPEPLYYKYGCVPLKDGSILGTEITTVPYQPKFSVFAELFESVCKYTRATQNNSLHVNISGFNNTPEFRVAMYNMYYRLQQEINAFIPIYKRELAYLTGKQGGPKDHCKPLERLNIVYRYSSNQEHYNAQVEKSDIEIFKFLNEGVYNNDFNIRTRRHQRDGGHKWDHHNRYYALNLMPLYFGNVAASRVEYRVHSGTVNPTKSMIWLLITAAITKFVENNTQRILAGKDKINLDDILKEVYLQENTVEGQFLYEYIREYITIRESLNINVYTTHRDIYGAEFRDDATFAFKVNRRDLFNFEPESKRT